MTQMTNVNALRIYESIEKYFGKVAADEFAEKFSLSKSADYLSKFKWAKSVCEYLESKYSPEDVRKIRMDCACGPSDREMENTKKLFTQANSLDQFVEDYNREYSDRHTVWQESDDLFFAYPACYCACVKRVNETISKSWCLCTLGYTKRLFEYAFDCDLHIELLESIKTGSNRCVMKITKVNS